MEFLQESTSEILVESEVVGEGENKTKKWFIEGVTLQAEVLNGNKRVYPLSVLKEAIDEHIVNLKENRCVGQLNHPLDRVSEIDPEQISHVFEKVIQDGNNFRTRAKVLSNTPKGKILESLLENEIKMGISSRGLGATTEQDGNKIVQKLQLVTLGDAVFQPSAPEAFLQAIREQKDFLYNNGLLVNKDLSEELDKYNKLLKESKVKDIQKTLKNILTDYFRKLT